MLKREWGAGSYRTYSVPCKIAALVPEFAVEDLPSVELQPRFLRLQRRPCPWAEHFDDDDEEESSFNIRLVRMYGYVNGVYRISRPCYLGGVPGIELITHLGRPFMSLCSRKSM